MNMKYAETKHFVLDNLIDFLNKVQSCVYLSCLSLLKPNYDIVHIQSW